MASSPCAAEAWVGGNAAGSGGKRPMPEVRRPPGRSPSSVAALNSESLHLTYRGTFIHVADQVEEETARSLRRSASDSDILSVHSESNKPSDQEHKEASVTSLADKLSSFWSVDAQRRSGANDGESIASTDGESQDLRSFFGEAQSLGFAGLQHIESSTSSSRLGLPQVPVTPGYFGSMTPTAEVAVVAAVTAATQSTLPETVQQETIPLSMSKTELKTKIRSNIKEISRNVHFHQRQQALCSIQELPEQVEEAMNQSATSLLTEVQDKVAIVADIIRERDRTGGAEKAVESLEGIPDMMKDSLEATVQKAKGVVREQIDDLVANVDSSSTTEEILKQVRALPAQVHQIAGDYLWRAVVQSEKQAAMQLDEVIERLPEETEVLEGAKAVMAREVMARKLPAVAVQAQSAARLAALEPVQQAVAAVSAEERDLQSQISNQVVADMLLRAKASQAEGALISPRSPRERSEQNGTSLQKEKAPSMHQRQPRRERKKDAAAESIEAGVAVREQHMAAAASHSQAELVGDPVDADSTCGGGGASAISGREGEPSAALRLPAFDGDALRLSGGNPGSIGHPDLCPRPCLFFAQGECTNGSLCEFCHLSHPKRPAHLDKRHREMIKRMTLVQVGEMLLPILKEKIQALQQDHEESFALLQQLASLCGCPDALDDDRPHQRPSSAERLLLVALQAMSLRLLLTSMHRSIPLENVEARHQVDKVLNHLRVTSYRELVKFTSGPADGSLPMPVFADSL